MGKDIGDKDIRQACAEVAGAGTGPVSDAMEFLGLPRAVSTNWRYVTQDATRAIVGPAYTVRQGPKSRHADWEENRTRQREASAELAQAGDVIVIEFNGRTDICAWGENQALKAQSRGISGLVVHGAIRDSEWIRRSGFPALCRGFSPVASRWDIETVAMNEPVTIDGVHIRPGDVIYADADAMIVIAREHVAAVFERVSAILAEEERLRNERYGHGR